MMKNTEERVRGIGHTVRHSDIFFFLTQKERKKRIKWKQKVKK